jgi:hypothetical protein
MKPYSCSAFRVCNKVVNRYSAGYFLVAYYLQNAMFLKW